MISKIHTSGIVAVLFGFMLCVSVARGHYAIAVSSSGGATENQTVPDQLKKLQTGTPRPPMQFVQFKGLQKKEPSQSKAPEPTKWEYKAVDFKGMDTAMISENVNKLASDGWLYVGPLVGEKVLFKRKGNSNTKPVVKTPAPKLEGDWVVTSAIKKDNKDKVVMGAEVSFTDKEMTLKTKGGLVQTLAYEANTKTTPMQIDFSAGQDKSYGIFHFQNGKLTIAISSDPKMRPTTFADTNAFLLVMKRKNMEKTPSKKK